MNRLEALKLLKEIKTEIRTRHNTSELALLREVRLTEVIDSFIDEVSTMSDIDFSVSNTLVEIILTTYNNGVLIWNK